MRNTAIGEKSNITTKTSNVAIQCGCRGSTGVETVTAFDAGELSFEIRREECSSCGGFTTRVFVNGQHSGTFGKSGRWMPREEIDEENIRIAKKLAESIPEKHRDKFTESLRLSSVNGVTYHPEPLAVKFIIPLDSTTQRPKERSRYDPPEFKTPIEAIEWYNNLFWELENRKGSVPEITWAWHELEYHEALIRLTGSLEDAREVVREWAEQYEKKGVS